MQKNGLKYVIVDADDSGNTGAAGGDNTGGNSGNTGDNSGENLSSYYNITSMVEHGTEHTITFQVEQWYIMLSSAMELIPTTSRRIEHI